MYLLQNIQGTLILNKNKTKSSNCHNKVMANSRQNDFKNAIRKSRSLSYAYLNERKGQTSSF